MRDRSVDSSGLFMPEPKVAMVTGSGRRLGALVATDLARRGWDIVIHCNKSRKEADRLAEVLRANQKVWVVEADLATLGGAESLVEQMKPFSPSLVVHSASLWTADNWWTAGLADWEENHRLQSWTAILLARYLWEKGGGHLVTILDARSRDRDSQHFSYGFAKREMASLTRFLAAELAPSVRVNGLALGMVLKPEKMPSREWTATARESTPLGRPGNASHVMKALAAVVGNPYLTGQILAVDGGRHLKGDLFGSI